MLNYSLKLYSYKNIFNQLVELDKNNKLPPRILLSGQEGIGKSTFAFHFINYLFSKDEDNKYNLTENTINSKNSSFNFISNLSHPNFYYISKSDEKKNIEIEQIRNMISFLNKSSLNNKKKVILIDGAEYLNLSSSNALLKSLEESNSQNIFFLTHNINKSILDTIKSRCLIYKLNFDYSETPNVINDFFDTNIYDELNEDFKSKIINPSFLINHINFMKENDLDLNNCDSKNIIKYIIDNKVYKKNIFIINNFQNYIEMYFTKMYSETKDYKYYDNFIKTVSENNLINKYNLDLDSFFIKFENKYLNI